MPQFLGMWRIDGGIPEKRVRNWIKIRSVGDANHPWPILYFAPQSIIATGYPESAIMLSSADYRSLAKLTAAQPCHRAIPPRAELERAGPYGDSVSWGIFQIDRSASGKRQPRCILMQAENCAYFARLADLPIHWKRDAADALFNMVASLRCRHGEDRRWEAIDRTAPRGPKVRYHEPLPPPFLRPAGS